MKHVVVVEDDPHNAVLFRKLLEKRGGYRVTVTESAEELFACCRANAALVILDVSLAHTRWNGRPINGVELCQILKNDPHTVGIPVVLATAHAMRGDAEKLIAESGANDYISKPIVDHLAFLEQIKSLLKEAA